MMKYNTINHHAIRALLQLRRNFTNPVRQRLGSPVARSAPKEVTLGGAPKEVLLGERPKAVIRDRR